MRKITSIYLENFQSIREAVELPIRPLTFLYGPNSAGKSAVHDALHLLNVALTSGDGLSDLVRRWTHKVTPVAEATAMVVGATFRVRGEFGGQALIDRVEFPDEFGEFDVEESSLSIFSGDIDAELTIKQELGADHMEPGRLSIWLDKMLVLEVWTDKVSDETTVTLNTNYFGKSLKDVIARYGFDPERPESYEVECYFERAPVRLRAISRENNDRRGLSNAILAISNYVLTAVVSWYRMPSLVAADRGLVDDSYLTFLAHAAANVDWLEHADPLIRADIDANSVAADMPAFSRLKRLVHERLIQKPDNPMRPIGKSRLTAHVQKDVRKLEAYGLRVEESMITIARKKLGLLDSPTEPLHDYVNRCLSDHLFLDQGYQIDFDICEVIRPDGVGPIAGFPYVTQATVLGGYSLHVFALISCFLRDRSGKLITFSDVGTGLSCVLRVLRALHSGFSFSQQPELHLHPAMQSALGDIYIERTGTDDERHLIESHSEYILLRCLRRIRETGAGKHLPGDPVALGPDQISILYFDPQQNGTTKIRKIRVTKDGEFIDRWPKGFFEERGKDLFDE
jgi:hypothetical protein